MSFDTFWLKDHQDFIFLALPKEMLSAESKVTTIVLIRMNFGPLVAFLSRRFHLVFFQIYISVIE